jgi:hypothetical protein
MNKYIIHVTSADNLGLAFLQDVVKIANLGATLQEGTLPSLRFPQIASFVLEAEQPPETKASVRVYDFDSKQEIVNVPLAVAASFSMEELDEGEPETKGEVVDTPEGFVALSKEALDALEFDTEFRAEVAKVGVKGRSRDKMTKEYLAKTAK